MLRTKFNIQMNFFSIIYSYISILELKETQNESSPQTSRHTTVKQEFYHISKLLDTIRENITSTEISQKVKHDLQGWFTGMVHN